MPAMSPEDKRRLVVFSAAVFCLFLFLLVLKLHTSLFVHTFYLCRVLCRLFSQSGGVAALRETRPQSSPWTERPVGSAALVTGQDLSGIPAAGRNKIRKSDARNSFASPSDRHFAGSYYRRDHTLSDSVFSPRDILMGSYLAKTEESPSAAVRPAGGSGTFMHPRDQFRERLARPNHAVHTPNRRLSFG